MVNEILAVVSANKFGQQYHIQSVTEVKIPKKWGINGVVTKRVVGNVQSVTSYEKNVNDRLAKVGQPTTFKAEPLPWGQWLKGYEGKVIEHNGAYYLRYYLNASTHLATTYYVNGREATASELATIDAYNKTRNKGSKKQEQAGLAKEEQTITCAINFDNLENLRCGSAEYTKTIPLAV